MNPNASAQVRAPRAADFADPINQILPNLYLGNLIGAKSAELLRKHEITHVLSLTTEPVKMPEELPDIVHLQFQVRDTRLQNLLQRLLEGIQFIEDAIMNAQGPKEVRVFVHCRMGISRSGSVVVGYIMKHSNLPFEAALDVVRARRPIVYPNRGFQSQLSLLWDSGFDLSHLGPDILGQEIDNPYQWEEEAAPPGAGGFDTKARPGPSIGSLMPPPRIPQPLLPAECDVHLDSEATQSWKQALAILHKRGTFDHDLKRQKLQ